MPLSAVALFLGPGVPCGGLLGAVVSVGLFGGFGRLRRACGALFLCVRRGLCLCWLMRPSRNAVV